MRRSPEEAERRRARAGLPTYRSRYGRSYHEFTRDGPPEWVEQTEDGRRRLYKRSFGDESDELYDFRLEKRAARAESGDPAPPPRPGDILLLVSGAVGPDDVVRERRRARVRDVRVGAGRGKATARTRTGRVVLEWID